MKVKNILISYIKDNYSTLAKVKSVLKKYKIKHKDVLRDNLRFSDYKKIDLVIAIGGDGTFLRAAQFIRDGTPILGVNANPKKKEGFFMQSEKKSFDKDFKRILDGKFKMKSLTRLNASINGKELPIPALNEFHMGRNKGYLMFRYHIKIKNKEEFQKSSGVLVGTAASSSAWLKSAGGKRMKLGDEKFQYVVREPYTGTKTKKYRFVNGILSKHGVVEVKGVNHGIVVADSVSREYNFKSKEKVRVYASPNSLNVVLFE